MPVNGYLQYQRIQTETASTGDLVVMLYRGALKFTARAEQALRNREYEIAHNSLVRAQEIILELSSSLDLNVGQIAENLRDIYLFMYRQLVEANCKKHVGLVEKVSTLLRELLSAWEVAVGEVNARTVARVGIAV